MKSAYIFKEEKKLYSAFSKLKVCCVSHLQIGNR